MTGMTAAGRWPMLCALPVHPHLPQDPLLLGMLSAGPGLPTVWGSPSAGPNLPHQSGAPRVLGRASPISLGLPECWAEPPPSVWGSSSGGPSLLPHLGLPECWAEPPPSVWGSPSAGLSLPHQSGAPRVLGRASPISLGLPECWAGPPASVWVGFPSRRGLTPRGSLECNPEIPAFPGEEN